MKAKRPGIPRSVALSRFCQSHRSAITLTAVVICLLVFVVDRSQRHNSGKDLQGTQPFSRKQLAAGHEVKFLESQHNLRHGNLLELPVEDTSKIFRGRPLPVKEAQGDVASSLNRIDQGFLANVNTSDLQAAAATGKSPPVSSKPLGYYFSKDIPAGVTNNVADNNPLGRSAGQNKAALGYYFNRDKSQDSETETQKAITHVQKLSEDAAQQSQEETPSSIHEKSRSANSRRKGMGLSSVVQTSVYLHQNEQQFSGQNDAGDAQSRQVAQQRHSPNELAVNLGVEFRPLTISLNTDDV